MNDIIYLDYNSTAPYSKSVKEYIQTRMVDDWANPSSVHALGGQLKARLEKNRAAISEYLDCYPGQIVFTSGATESISTILSPQNLQKHGISVVFSNKMEHAATLRALDNLAPHKIEVVYFGANSDGSLNYGDFSEKAASYKNGLVSILYVNNETGIINDIPLIAQVAKKHGHLVHVDAVQALGKMEFSVEDLDVDFMSFSGHKIGSLKGVGLLYARDMKKVHPLVLGGGQEFGMRSGTSFFAGIESFSLALNDLDFSFFNDLKSERDKFEGNLVRHDSNIIIIGKTLKRVFNTSSIVLPNIKSVEAALALSRHGIMVSPGAACSSGNMKSSHVVGEIIGGQADQTLRVSSGSDAIVIHSYEKILSHLVSLV